MKDDCEDISQELEQKIDANVAAKLLDTDGEFVKHNKNFKARPTQLSMLKSVCHAFNEGLVGLFEARTGVGKSYAYLIPAILWASSNKSRTVLSTGTISLQQQLVDKDIPTVANILKTKIKIAIVKGRQNYLCLRRLSCAKDMGADLFLDINQDIKTISDWAEITQTGDRSELGLTLQSNASWGNVNCDNDSCTGNRCLFFAKCFFTKSRKNASEASLLVVNHHLLFADIAQRLEVDDWENVQVLPAYNHLILDEAHTIQTAATSFFSKSFNRIQIARLLRTLYRKSRGNVTGYMFTYITLSGHTDSYDKAVARLEDIERQIVSLEECAIKIAGNDYSIRLCKSTQTLFAPLNNHLQDLVKAILDFKKMLDKMYDDISENDATNDCVVEVQAVLKKLEEVGNIAQDFLSWQEVEDSVLYIQIYRTNEEAHSEIYAQFSKTPLDISQLLYHGIFENTESVVCCSATLCVAGDFSFFMRRTGVSYLPSERVLTGVFDSPFCYKKNMLFCVPTDIPMPNEAGFATAAENAIYRLLMASRGRTLVLFTSYALLNEVARAIAPKLHDINLFVQGQQNRYSLLEAFKEDITSVLFGTSSFWEGVDVSGQSLSQVIIVRLPFGVPNDPVFCARNELYGSKASSFVTVALPEALTRFIQGVGRLIRHEDDRGVVVVLDTRIVKKSYGDMFIRSLPQCQHTIAPLKNVAKAVKDFL